MRKDYACQTLPFHRHQDGMADVFYATHKGTSTPVVLKQLHGKNPALSKKARMAREIQVGRFLNGHPHAMPVWDAGPDSTWFVMPVAKETAAECRDRLKEPAALRALVSDLCSVLSAAHGAHEQGGSQGWVHRDIKPSNVLRLDGRWVLADWGITRRPAGLTTHPQRTKVGMNMGSLGFAAPELTGDPHSAGPPADIYSLGQLIGWAVTGKDPLENIAQVPDSGPWRAVVREATRRDPERRPPTVQAFLDLVAREIETSPVPPLVHGETLRDSLEGTGEAVPDAPEQLVALAAAHPDDAALYCDVLVRVSPEVLLPALMADPSQAVEIVRAMPELLGTHRPPERGEVDAVIFWLFAVARHAADAAELHLLEECCNGAFTWDALWDQWRPQDEIRPWLRTLRGDAAASVAGALRDHPDCARHFSSLANDVHVDHRIRSAVSGKATPRTPSPATASPDQRPAHGAGSQGVGVARSPAPRQTASNVRYCQTLERWGRFQGWWGHQDYDSEYIATVARQINDVADRLAGLTPQARALLTQVLEHGDSSSRHMGLPGTEIRLALGELRRRAQIGGHKITELFAELEGKGFGHIDPDPDFGEAPPEVVVFDSSDRQAGTTILRELCDFAAGADVPLDAIVNGRFDLLD
ncbi:serine/threonine-protein kinase [Streptomyces fulvoviolaceus]|uniref:serine/threonine-protein kinase n=1 Tax=Streptomyces fulvoviolaceus TaxID=285535 RepID=UPI000693B474|nr:serine/threonine-protein kinase [Streptomyces fulvoviolaceus]